MSGTGLPVRNPDFEAVARRIFAQQGFMTGMGVAIAGLGPGWCELVLDTHPAVLQQNGYVHGGALGAIGDTAGGLAAVTLAAPGHNVLTVEYKINMMAPARGDRVRALGRTIRAGRTLTVCQTEVFARADGVETLCALVQQTLMLVPDAG